MPLVKYTANRVSDDGTGLVKISDDRVLILGGAPVDVSTDEVARLSSSFVLEEVEVEQPVSQSPPSPPQVSSTPPVSPSTPVSVGSTPSSTTPLLPTPPEGN